MKSRMAVPTRHGPLIASSTIGAAQASSILMTGTRCRLFAKRWVVPFNRQGDRLYSVFTGTEGALFGSRAQGGRESVAYDGRHKRLRGLHVKDRLQSKRFGGVGGPGHWNDPDMLEVGNGGMTNTEYRTHMSLWAMLTAPLLAGNDLRTVSPEILRVLTNHDLIAVDQDREGKQAVRMWKSGEQEVWTRPLANGDHAVAFFNRAPQSARINVAWKDVGMTRTPKHARDHGSTRTSSCTVRSI
jgi:Alpha galactosidase A/Alpha galactosidase C-terminal beta sandwich domain